MSETAGIWSEIDLAGHCCHVFDPAVPSLHGYVVIYLHCNLSASLRGYPAFMEQF